jgi:hypothetical protein
MRARAAMVITAAVLGALALAAGAAAGGFATVGLSSLPDGTAPGKPWHVTLTILQHGRTPLPNLQPTVTVTSADGAMTRTFAARPGREAGIYTADVVFPTAGVWRYAINDSFSQIHRFAPVRVGSAAAVAAAPAAATPAATPDDSGANLGAALAAAAVAGILAALLAAAVMHRRRPAADPTPAAPAR